MEGRPNNLPMPPASKPPMTSVKTARASLICSMERLILSSLALNTPDVLSWLRV
jgi:hypothetical protein